MLHILVVSLVFCSLQIDDTEVEYWVVKAISAKLLDCKIDQMNQAIIVRCAFCGPRPLLLLPMLYLKKLDLVNLAFNCFSLFIAVFLSFCMGVVQPMYRACIWDRPVAITSNAACNLEGKSYSS